MSLFADKEVRAISLFQKFNKEEKKDKCLDYEDTFRINDIEAAKIIMEVARVENTTQVQNFEKEKRDIIIKQLKNARLSIR